MPPLPVTNWSLRKALRTLPDSFSKARVRIIYVMLAFSILKAAIVLGVAIYADQAQQLPRAIIALVCYSILLKMLLSRPSWLPLISHTMLIAGVLLIWSNIFVYAQNISLITLQFVFMAILGAFYVLGIRAGITYTILVVSPILIFLFSGGNGLDFAREPQNLASPGFEIITTLNFITIVFAHYYFFKASEVNIREKEALNLRLQATAAEAKKLAEARSSFLATMSHELRTPLNSVIGVTELMLEDKTGRQDENLDILRNSALDLLSLINNILDINKLDSGKLQLENVSFNLYDLVSNICSVLQVKARDKKLELELHADPAIKQLRLDSDPTRLSQVIYNLVGNAIKFTEKGKVSIKLEKTAEENSRVDIRFSVTDTGIGIHPDRHREIFEIFTQAEAHTTRKYGGTGLGLAIVQQVLALFSSGIQVESAPGKGSSFLFTISFDVSAKETAPVALHVEKAKLDHLKILVAEDNDINKLVLQKQLDYLNVRSVMVTDGLQAYEACIREDFDAVLLDLDMPVWDGYETTRKIRSNADPVKSGAYLIAFTASVSEQKHIIDKGFDDFLYKPVSMNDLREKLEKVMLKKIS